MKQRYLAPAICALLFVAPFIFAREPHWYTQPGTPVVLESSGFVFHAILPRGWSLTTEQLIVPPPAMGSSCRLRGEFYTDVRWGSFLEAAFRSTDGVSTAKGTRFVQKIGGHAAVSNRYVRDLVVHDIYINLSDIRPDSGAVWTFEGSSTEEGLDCEAQFLAMINSATITSHR